MPGIRFAIIGVALVGAALFQSALAAPPVPSSPSPFAPPALEKPPAKFADYLAKVKAADSVQGDEARCRATPDLPDNQWIPGAAQGRCAILRAPAFTLEQIDALLATQAGVTALESKFASLLEAHYRDPAQRDQIFRAYRVFDASPLSGAVAQRWLKLAPQSPFARTALGAHFSASGWQARGTAYAADTSDAQFERMSGYFAQAVPLYKQALEIEPRLSVACARLNSIGRASDAPLREFARAHCLKVDPDSYYVHAELIGAAEPRWSRSFEALDGAVAFAKSRSRRNPALGTFLGQAVGYEASRADSYGEVVNTLVAAARMGPNPEMMAYAGKGYRENRLFWASLVYYSQALRFLPNDTWYRYARARLLTYHLNDYAWARSDMDVALRQEPDEPGFLLLRGEIALLTETPAAARVYFQRGMKGERAEEAMKEYCDTYGLDGTTKEAEACARDMVRKFPKSALAWYTLSRVLDDHDRKGSLAALEKVKAFADPRSTRDRGLLIRAEEILKSHAAQPGAGASGK